MTLSTCYVFFFFFFSSRRRHTRLQGDWSSDVCSSDLVAPGSPDAVGLLLGTAREEGWRVRIEGAGTWMPSDAPCDLALTTRRLDRVPAIEPQDLSATAEAGGGLHLPPPPPATPPPPPRGPPGPGGGGQH